MIKYFKKLFRSQKTKVFVLGIDGAPPQLIFDQWLNDLPNIKKLMDNSIYGRMSSSVPPSTIVAWTSMLSGKDPSHFDVYSYTYKDEENKIRLSSSSNVKAKRIWKYLDQLGKKSILLNVPLTYPVEELNGIMIGGFLSPEFNDKSVYPAGIRKEIERNYTANYPFDVSVGLAGYKNLDTDKMIERSYQMTKLNLDISKDFIINKKWDFFMIVLLGSDRMQHTMWRFHDVNHRRYPGETKYKNSLKEYYQFVDREIEEIKSKLDKNTYLIIASDHGFDRMDGRINLNDWFIREGYLVLKEVPKEPGKLDFKNVDWSKTKCYAIGAYFGRIYFNRKNRDPNNGIIEENQIEILQDELITKLKSLKNDLGEGMDTTAFKSQDIYDGPYKENGPDLYLYFDQLKWGVNNDVGNEGLYSQRTTKGSDDAGHGPTGLFMLHHPSIVKQERNDIEIIDVLPTIFSVMGIKEKIEGEFKGKVLI
ncbi:MAG TPA: alkaline phosphatase family protein [Candidatus Nanoarchaeia archaeon]|nr:alkaline phosphatase family protein [Candidatus Nanoarchaeia archaeon]